jgi:hypothetical protein
MPSFSTNLQKGVIALRGRTIAHRRDTKQRWLAKSVHTQEDSVGLREAFVAQSFDHLLCLL